MKVTAKLNHLRIAPRKVRLVADLIRRKKVEEAQSILSFTVKKASSSLLKLLNSAIANAKNNLQLDSGNLYISKITVDEGRKYKRWRQRARGRASGVEKKTSHITLVLEEIKPTKKKPKKATKPKVSSGSPAGGRQEVEAPKKKPEAEKEEPEKDLGLEEIKDAPQKEKFEKEKPKRKRIMPKIPRGIRRIFRRKAF